MSIRARLEVTPTFRGDDYTRPVHVGHDGTRVVLVADRRHAELLSQIIARVASNAVEGDDIDRDLWIHVALDLDASATLAGLGVVDQADVPVPLEVVQ